MRWHPNAFTADWLEDALSAPRGSLKAFDATPIGTGQMSLSFRVRLSWKEHPGPATIVAKCSSTDPVTRATAKSLRNYSLELGWYRDLAKETAVACPPCLHLEANEDETEFVLLLGDLAPARQGDQISGASLTQVRAALLQAARLHGPYWNSPRIDEALWLRPRPDIDSKVRQIVAPLYVQFRERYADRLSAAVLEAADAFVARIAGYFEFQAGARTIQHRDLRLDNLLFSPDEASAFVVDWQTVSAGPAATDIAYLISTSLANREVRAQNERELVAGYVDELRALGADARFEDVWREYRVYSWAGLVMAIIASMSVIRTARGDEMFAVMAERSVWQAIDLDSLSLLDN